MGGFASMAACDNATDFAALANRQPDNARTLAASVAVQQCNHLILDQAMFTECVTLGVANDDSVPNLSLECATCYGELAWCSVPNCNVACQNDSCLPGCLTCLGYDVCRQALNDCTGRTPPECGET